MFETFVEYIYSQAISFMIIEYPKSIERIKLRKTDRHRANFPASYSQSLAGITTQGSGTLRDLSMDGALFSHQKPLTKNSQISISFNVPQGSLSNLTAEVRNIRKNAKNDKEPFITGLKFLAMSDAHLQIMRQFLETRSIDRRSENRS